jgi:hypothetical protein
MIHSDYPKSSLCDVIPADAGIQALNFTRKHGFLIESGMTNFKNRGFRTHATYL